ncbi:cyclase family protein [Clostridium sediminicola]|uniref:cyclase family protein n=1 Tax=Clostridium sediminicola TaxID=3114879 RepID=UPI0031F21CCB
MQVLDLSHTFENGMPVFPGAPEPTFQQIGDVKNNDDTYQIIKFDMITHLGTHIDCNTHVSKEGYYTDTQDMGFFIGKGIVIDCSSYGKGEKIGMEIFDNIDVSDKEFILIYCDWAKYWGQEAFFGEFPYLSEEVVEFVRDHDTIRGIGFEYASIDPLSDADLKLHKILMTKEKTIIENLTNLDKLLNKEFTFIAMPLKFKGGEGSPVRAVAII